MARSKKQPRARQLGELARALHIAWMDVVLSGRGYVLMTKDGARRMAPEEIKRPKKGKGKR